MANHKVYGSIIQAVKSGRLVEPFTNDDFRNACPGLGCGTYQAFLHKHSNGNPGGYSVLFLRNSPGKFSVIKPYKYGF